MTRTLVVSDIHGCYDEFNELLKTTQYNPEEDKLILLGDYCDRGLKSKQVIEQIMNLVSEWGIVAIRGNHDQMFLNALYKDEDYIFLHNGGIHTIESYVGYDWFVDYQGFDFDQYVNAKDFIKQHYAHHIKFLRSLPVYHEDDDYIYVHAGLNPLYENWKEQPTENFLWIRDLFIDSPTVVDKTVIFGHTPTINMQETEGIWYGGDKIGVDGGCVFGFNMLCLEISEKGYKQYAVERRVGN
jgi:serine/threonine protein phosphatase 1